MEVLAGRFSPAVHEQVSGCLSLLAANDVTAALDRIRTVDALAPETSLSAHLIGLASVRLGEPAKALAAFENAHAQAPQTREHAEALGILHAKLGHIADSLYFGKLAIAATTELGLPDMLPDWLGSFADAFYRMNDAPILRQAEAFLAAGEIASALRCYRQATEVEPRSVAAWRGLATTALGTPAAPYRPGEGLAASRILIDLPDAATQDRTLHATLLAANGSGTEGFEIAVKAGSTAKTAYVPIRLMARTANPDQAVLAALARNYTARSGFPLEPRTSEALAEHARRFQLGVIGGDWGDGDWSRSGGLGAIVPVVLALPNTEIALTVYADDQAGSPLCRRLKQRADHWHDIRPLDDETLACIIANDRLDALIDLDGTIGCARPAVFSARPAPLQFSLYGIPGVVAALGFDGAARTDTGAAEDLVVAGGLGVLPADLPDDPLPDVNTGPVAIGIFGSLAATRRGLPMLIDLLRKLPDAAFRLDTERLGGSDLATTIRRDLPEDIAYRTTIQPPGSHLIEYFAGVDLLIDLPGDPYPDVGIAAVGLGLPVLTSRTRQPRAALLAGWLDSVGLGAWISADEAELVSAAIDLVRDLATPRSRRSARDGLNERMRTERRVGAGRQARRLIDALHLRWRKNHVS